MRAHVLIFTFLLVAVGVSTVHADGDILFLNANGTANLTQLSLRVIPGTTNTTSFRVVAQNDNISSLAFFGFSQDLNLTVSPPNRTVLPDGDYQLVTVSVSVANNTQAGFRVASIITLTTKPQQLLLPLVVEIPSTTEWNVTPQTIVTNVTPLQFGEFNITLSDTGNIPISGHVSVVDLAGILYFDSSDFTLQPGVPLSRPLYYFVGNRRPATYSAAITFIDSLQNTRRVTVNLTLPDTTTPLLNVTLDRSEVYPGQTIGVRVTATDDVNVSAVQYRLDTTNITAAGRNDDGSYAFELTQLRVGDHSLVVLANDSAGNLATFQKQFTVTPFAVLNATASVDFLKFRPPQERSVRLLSALQPVMVNVTLQSLVLDASANNSLNISIGGTRFNVGDTKQVNVAGDFMITATPGLLTQFSGAIGIQTDPTIYNPAPTIAFRGEVANYSITPAFNTSIPGFGSVLVCNPRIGASLQESALHCDVDFQADTPKSQVAVVGSPDSLEAERTGYKTQIFGLKNDLGTSQLINWLAMFLIITLLGSYFFKVRYWDQRVRVS